MASARSWLQAMTSTRVHESELCGVRHRVRSVWHAIMSD
jgi:hypothetical protein